MEEDDKKYLVEWEENLFSIFCDILETSDEFLQSGIGINLDDIIESISKIEHFEEMVGEKKIKDNATIFPHYKKVRESVSEIREIYYSYFSKEKIGGALLKEMMDEVRVLIGKMERGIGKIQYVTEGIEDVRERMELREFIKKMVYFKKLIRRFNDALSRIDTIEWNAGYSKTHLHIVPKIESAYRPIMSNMVEVEVQDETEIEITVGEKSVVVETNGALFLNFFAFSKIPDMYVKKIIIDKRDGVEIIGDGKKVNIFREGKELKVMTSEL